VRALPVSKREREQRQQPWHPSVAARGVHTQSREDLLRQTFVDASAGRAGRRCGAYEQAVAEAGETTEGGCGRQVSFDGHPLSPLSSSLNCLCCGPDAHPLPLSAA
jgi:hypothetical protein